MRRSHGFSLIEVMAALLLGGILIVGIAGTLGQFSNQQRSLMARLASVSLTANLRRAISDESALMNTLFNPGNSVFDCLRAVNFDPLTGMPTSTGCAGQSGTLNSVVTSSGQQVADFSDSTSGFTASGEACTGFGVDPKCVARAQIDVSFVCETASACLKPQIVFSGKLEVMTDGHLVDLGKVFEVRKDWSAMNVALKELGSAAVAPGGIVGNVFKLLIIVDNSTSMLAYQQRLSESLDPMLENLKSNDFNLAVQILSTSQYLMGQSNNYTYPKPVNSSQQILQLSSVSCSDGTKTEQNYCGSVPMSGVQKEVYTLKAPTEVVLPANATAAQFTTFKSTILSTIAGMGVAGSDDEQGLCTLSRLLTNGNTFIQAGDKVGVIIIANEQDSSTAKTCATEINRKYDPNGSLAYSSDHQCNNETSFNSITDNSIYMVKARAGQAGYRIDYTCQKYRDGAFVPYDPNDPTSYRHDASIPNHAIEGDSNTFLTESITKYGIDLNKKCEDSGINFTSTAPYTQYGDQVIAKYAPCPEAIKNKVARLSSCGYYENGKFVGGSVVKCEVSCSNALNYGMVMVRNSNSGYPYFRQLSQFSTNYCNSSFSFGGVKSDTIAGQNQTNNFLEMISGNTYNNIAHLFSQASPELTIWNGAYNCCRVNQYHRPYPSGIGDTYKSVFEPFNLQNEPIENAILQRANALLGSDGYFISAIINPSAGASMCPAKQNESVGTAFETLTSKTAHSIVVPICSADYSPALTPLQEFIEKTVGELVGNDKIKLSQGEQIVRIYVNNGTQNFQFPVGGSNGVWPTLTEHVSGSTDKIYQLDFSRTGYSLNATDRVWATVVTQSGEAQIDHLGGSSLGFEAIRSLYRIGLGH